MNGFIARKMQKADLGVVVSLLADDELGRSREDKAKIVHADYLRAFEHIDSDVNQYAAIFEINGETIGCLQITFIPGLSRRGSLRGQIEGVRVSRYFRGKGYGSKMIAWAITKCRDRGCKVVQLTSDKKRENAIQFYEKHGFVRSHEGFKLTLAGVLE
ncbi:MAG: GNAT family N-acetyltransferase [Candidatus Puniceispirillaceae bacterium]